MRLPKMMQQMTRLQPRRQHAMSLNHPRRPRLRDVWLSRPLHR